MKDKIDGALLKEMVLFGAASISLEKQSINDLNVFPVPDGDTGTNMSLTIGNAAAELRKKTPATVEEAAKITASALLRGARGNSGVILSLLFRGISRSLKGQSSMDGVSLANALQEGVAAAYSAVMKPAEGTVLTVSRLAAKRAVEAATERNSAEYVLQAAIEEGQLALADTVNQNPVLKKAGVVDAGGKGFLVILSGMLSCLRGEPMPEGSCERETAAKVQDKADFESIDTESITFAFDTVYIVRKKSEDVDLAPLRAYLDSIGDSLVIGEDDESFKVHVHTNIPGEALTESQKYGTLELAKIENMRTQHDDLAAGRHVQSTDDLDQIEEELERGCTGESGQRCVAAPEKKYGFISVCAGDGIAGVFRDLGCDGIISGGQTMNPSTESILDVIDQTPAEVVFVLPNNKNIIMAAQQCQHLSDKQIVVIPSASVPQGMAAMLAVDTESDTDAIEAAMNEAIARVITAQITYAARDSDIDGFAIKAGEYLALKENNLFGSDTDIAALLEKLADTAKEQDAEFITMFYGSDVSEEDAQKAEAIFAAACPDAEVSLLPGGQPVYYYIISIE
ncbi:MAG: DAK2 domain-containing protein [Clostridiales bacterium]|nr:DAK2 domain-containing protein [Clostridiales bacterium]MDY4036729.1 DAK2 domain-containing protein [Candidatus Pseudoscilispira sp.]